VVPTVTSKNASWYHFSWATLYVHCAYVEATSFTDFLNVFNGAILNSVVTVLLSFSVFPKKVYSVVCPYEI